MTDNRSRRAKRRTILWKLSIAALLSFGFTSVSASTYNPHLFYRPLVIPPGEGVSPPPDVCIITLTSMMVSNSYSDAALLNRIGEPCVIHPNTECNLMAATSMSLACVSPESWELGPKKGPRPAPDAGVSVTLDLTHRESWNCVESDVECVVHCIRRTIGSSWTLNLLCDPDTREKLASYERRYPGLPYEPPPQIDPETRYDSLEEFAWQLLASNPARSPGYLRDLFTPDGPAPYLQGHWSAELVPVMINHVECIGSDGNVAYILATARCNNMASMCIAVIQMKRWTDHGIPKPYWEIEASRNTTVTGPEWRVTCEASGDVTSGTRDIYVALDSVSREVIAGPPYNRPPSTLREISKRHVLTFTFRERSSAW